MLSTWKQGPENRQMMDIHHHQGFEEDYHYIDGKHIFNYTSRIENYCYRNNYLMLTAYDGYWAADDSDKLSENRVACENNDPQNRPKPMPYQKKTKSRISQRTPTIGILG